MTQRILVTGATGAVGREIVAQLLSEHDVECYVLLHAHGAGGGVAELLEQVYKLPSTPDYVTRLHAVAGDITRPQLGLPAEQYAELSGALTHIIHGAAATRFDLQLESARRVNVRGTREALRLAGRCERLDLFGFLSTAYVSGKRRGTVYESEREHGDGFANTYEQSKYEAEALVEAAGEILPVTTYRLSTVLGNSRTGSVALYTAPHQALRIMHLGLAAMVPGTSEYCVDLIAADYTAATLCALVLGQGRPGGVYHLTAAEEKSYTLEEIIDASYRYLAEHDPEWRKRRYPQPVIASREAFDLFMHSVQQAKNPIMYGVMSALQHFAHQLTYPKTFDRTSLLRALPEYETRMPDVRDYYCKVVAHCLSTRWGRNAG